MEEGFLQPPVVLPLGFLPGEDDKIIPFGKGFLVLSNDFLDLALHPVSVVGLAEFFRQADPIAGYSPGILTTDNLEVPVERRLSLPVDPVEVLILPKPQVLWPILFSIHQAASILSILRGN